MFSTGPKVFKCFQKSKNITFNSNYVYRIIFLTTGSVIFMSHYIFDYCILFFRWSYLCGLRKKNFLWACGVSNTIKTGEVCDCSGNTCTDAEYCYGGVCNTNPVGIFIIFPIFFCSNICMFELILLVRADGLWQNQLNENWSSSKNETNSQWTRRDKF